MKYILQSLLLLIIAGIIIFSTALYFTNKQDHKITLTQAQVIRDCQYLQSLQK